MKIFEPDISVNGCRIFMDIMTWENCRQFSLLAWNSFIGQFVDPVGGKGMEKRGGWGNRYFIPRHVSIY